MEQELIQYNFYKITSPLGNGVYIGKTKKDISLRFIQHVSNYGFYTRNGQFGGVNFTSSFALFEEYGVENCQINIITSVQCSSKQQACMLEGLFILNFKNNRDYRCVNKNIAGRTRQEYRHANIEKINGKHDCPCSGKYTYQGYGQHCRTTRHMEYIANRFVNHLI